MELYSAFIDRINAFQQNSFTNCEQNFLLNPSVREKVSEDGKLSPLFGETVVFMLSEDTNAVLVELQDRIYETAGEYLGERLTTDTFHMTLHDLCIFGGSITGLSQCYQEVVELTESIKRKKFVISMRTTWVFNMSNTSIVLGLMPTNEAAYNSLMMYYYLFDEHSPAPYPLTPHITLAYYKSQRIPAQTIRSLAALSRETPYRELNVSLDSDRLGYYSFSSMNRYERIYPDSL